jgi:hypothetical protein
LITGDWIMAVDDPKPAHAAPVHREVANVGVRLGPRGEAQPVPGRRADWGRLELGLAQLFVKLGMQTREILSNWAEGCKVRSAARIRYDVAVSTKATRVDAPLASLRTSDGRHPLADFHSQDQEVYFPGVIGIMERPVNEAGSTSNTSNTAGLSVLF